MKKSLYSNGSKVVPIDYEKTSVVVVAKTVDALANAVYSQGGYYTQDGSIYRGNTSYYYSELTAIAQGTYACTNIKTAGDARIAFFDKYKTFISCAEQGLLSSLQVPSGTCYIGVSAPPAQMNPKPKLIPSSDIVVNRNICYGEESYINNCPYAKEESGMVTFSTDSLNCGRWRMHFHFRLKDNVDSVGSHVLASLGGLEIGCSSTGNALLSETNPTYGFTTKYPVPSRTTRWFQKVGTSYLYSDYISLPNYKELIGEDAFSIRYVGEARNHDYTIDDTNVQAAYDSYNNSLKLSFVGGLLTITNGSTTIFSENVASKGTVGALVTYLKTQLQDFDFHIYCDSSTKLSQIADINEVYLVSTYYRNSHSSSETRYDAFPCFFQFKVNNDVHSCEIVCDDGQIAWMVDGIGKQSLASASVSDIEDIVICKDNDIFGVIDYELNIGTLADAEVVNPSKIISCYNPNILLLEAHTIFEGDEADGLSPIYLDETATGAKKAVIPTKYRSVIGGSALADCAMSNVRFIKVCQEAQKNGYEWVKLRDLKNIQGKHPAKRLWNICFDDHNQYFFKDMSVRQVIGRMGIKPTLAVSYYATDLADNDYKQLHRNILDAGWELAMHGYKEPDWWSFDSSRIYDVSSTDTSITTDANTKKFNIQRITADMLSIDWSTMVYGSGSCNPNVIKAFSHLGVEVGVMTNTGVPTCSGMNQYYLRRVNCSDHTAWKNVVKFFI